MKQKLVQINNQAMLLERYRKLVSQELNKRWDFCEES